MKSSKETLQELKQKVAELEEQLEREQKQAAGRVPKMAQKYWFLRGDGGILTSLWASITEDHDRLAFGNVYLTEAEAIKAQQQKLAEVRVINRLRELDGGFVADWSGEAEPNFTPFFTYIENTVHVEGNTISQWCPYSWISTRESWEQVIKEMESDVKLMMGVEL